jgi:hypothetical protein
MAKMNPKNHIGDSSKLYLMYRTLSPSLGYSSFVYFDLCLQRPPYRMTKNGIGASKTHDPASTVKPQP